MTKSVLILAVEDDPGDFGLIRAYTSLAGLDARNGNGPVIWAKTLFEGIAAARSSKPDIILLDLSLPDSDGLATMQAMRSALPCMPIVVLTGCNDEALADAVLQAGAQDYLVKGQFGHDALSRAVRYAMARNALEQQLNENIQRLELALAGGDLGTWDWHMPDGTVIFNKRWCEMLGCAYGEIESSIPGWRERVHPDDLDAFNTALKLHWRGEAPVYEAEYRMRHNGDRWVWVLDRGKVVEWGADGKPLRMAGTCLDITRQKQAEKVLLESRNYLSEQVGEMTSQLKELRSEFEDVNTTLKVLLKNQDADKSAAQSALTRDMSQEVAPFLLKLKKSVHDRRQTHLLEILENNLQHLATAYGNAGSNSLFLQLTPVETQVASMIKQGLSTKDIAVAMSLSAETINVHRKHIRKKLKLGSKTTNLRDHLLSLSR